MKIKEFKKYVDEAYKNGENDNVEFWLELEDDSIMCELESIGQFHIVRDMTITIKLSGSKVYSSKELSDEQLDFKEQRDNLERKIHKIQRIINED